MTFVLPLLLTYLIASSVAAEPPAAPASSHSPIFFAVCKLSHRSFDDPIVHRGHRGAAHAHSFTGAWSTNAFSTFRSLRRSGTTCNMPADRSAYWTPTVYDAAGRPIWLANFAYFVAGDKPRESIKPYPNGLRMVADMSAGHGSGWHCGRAAPPPRGVLSRTTIPTCPDGVATHLQAKVVFPDCWNGKDLDSPDHRSHMAYARRSGRCPRRYPVPVPRLNLKSRYDSYGGPGLTVSSGDASTFHADFFQAWVPWRLKRLVRECLNLSTGEPRCRAHHEGEPNPSFPKPHPPPKLPVAPRIEPD